MGRRTYYVIEAINADAFRADGEPPLPVITVNADLESRVSTLEAEVSRHDDLIAALWGLPLSGITDLNQVSSGTP
jgi:hypothetical protein